MTTCRRRPEPPLRSRPPQAAVTAAKAAVEQAQLNLSFTKITSLVDGVAGIAQAQIGDLGLPPRRC